MTAGKNLKVSQHIGLTTEGEGRENTYSKYIFGQFQTVLKSELIVISLRGKEDLLRLV